MKSLNKCLNEALDNKIIDNINKLHTEIMDLYDGKYSDIETGEDDENTPDEIVKFRHELAQELDKIPVGSGFSFKYNEQGNRNCVATYRHMAKDKWYRDTLDDALNTYDLVVLDLECIDWESEAKLINK